MKHLETKKPGRHAPAQASPTADPLDAGRRTRLLCARCAAAITTDDQRIEVGGAHEHYFVNPHGFDFRVGCFSEAPGVTSAGRASHEFTWFPGHTWQLDLCTSCTIHLGWIFRSPRAIFHGLILDRLTRAADD